MQMVRDGHQYIALDLSLLDYIYSDSINKFINLNRSILDINGRIILVAPHPKVYELLGKAGIFNFIKVVHNLEEVQKLSMMIQPVNAPVAPVAPVQEQPIIQEPVQQISPVQEQFQQAPPVQEQPIVQEQFQQAPPVQGQPIIQEQFQQPLPQEETAPPPPPVSNDIFATGGVAPVETTNPGFDFFGGSEAPAAPVEQAAPPAEDDMTREYSIEELKEHRDAPVEESVSTKEERNPFDDEEEKKGLPIIPIIAALLIVGVIIGTTLFIINGKKKSTEPLSPTMTTTQEEPKAPEPVVDTVKEVEPEVKETPKEPVKKSTPKKVVTQSTPKKVVPKETTPIVKEKEPVKNDVITLISNPSGAIVYANGRRLGTTPYTWTTPTAFSDIDFSFQKEGYEEKKLREEYTGGAKEVFARLSEKPKEEPKPDPVVTEVKEEPKPVVTEVKKEEPKPVVTEVKKEEPKPMVTEVKKEEPKPVVTETAPVKEESGAVATIFFSSLPRVADIYENGQKVGQTNIKPITTTVGSHTYTFKKGTRSATATVTLREGKNSHPMIRLR